MSEIHKKESDDKGEGQLADRDQSTHPAQPTQPT